jgi:hypothetical protein
VRTRKQRRTGGLNPMNSRPDQTTPFAQAANGVIAQLR